LIFLLLLVHSYKSPSRIYEYAGLNTRYWNAVTRGVTSINLKPNRSPTRTQFDQNLLPERSYRCEELFSRLTDCGSFLPLQSIAGGSRARGRKLRSRKN
jgi:hypothetical protein